MTDDRYKSTHAAYDRVAADFAHRTSEPSVSALAFIERFAKSLEPDALVADVDCGAGHEV